MSLRFITAVLLAAACVLPGMALAQNAYFFPSDQDFDERIPTPQQFLGYEIGTHYTRHDQLVAYFRELDRLSDRISVREIGKSYEERPLIVATVTSAANHARLEQIRSEHVSLIDPVQPLPPATAPVVVFLAYSVHGAETSSGEAAMLTAYYLAANRNAQTLDYLDKAVVLIDPAQNPDGRDRAAGWHNAWKSNPPVADALDKEHLEPFPGGRTNHYFTDLNRDWLAITQRETQPKIDFFHQWYPNVQIDFHEMGAGSSYYFEPSPVSMQSPLLPQASYDFNRILANYHAQGLDALGSLYYTGENFDNFSPVYGSTYPDFHGAVGVTVEQASSRGLVQDTAAGPLSFPFTIRNQVATGLSTLRGAVAEREGLFKLQKDFYRSALTQAGSYPVKSFVFGDADDPSLTRKLLDLLLRHRIRVHELAGEVSVDGKRFSPGTAYVVPSLQPQFRLVHSIFEETPPIKGDVFYGSTSYGIAQAYGLKYAKSRSAIAPGARVQAVTRPQGAVIGGPAAYAYALEWSDYNASRALYRLLSKDVVVRAAFRPFTAQTASGERRFGYGSLVIPVAGQRLDAAALHAAVQEAAAVSGLSFHALASGRSVAGIDLGSDSVKVVHKPSVALVMGQGVNATEIGAAWFLLSEQVNLPATRLDPSQLAKVPLHPYTSIVLAGGNYQDLGKEAVAALRQWIEAGGSLVTFGSASQWAIEQKLADERLVGAPAGGDKPDPGKAPASGQEAEKATQEGETPKAAAAAPVQRLDFDSQRDVGAIERISGNLISADADISHPLAFGLRQRAIFVNKEGGVVLQPSRDAFSTAVRIDQVPQVNGYLSAKNRSRIAGSAYALVSKRGAGNVVLFADDPAHRKYWHGTERLLLNSLFFADQLNPAGRPR